MASEPTTVREAMDVMPVECPHCQYEAADFDALFEHMTLCDAEADDGDE